MEFILRKVTKIKSYLMNINKPEDLIIWQEWAELGRLGQQKLLTMTIATKSYLSHFSPVEWKKRKYLTTFNI